MGKWIKRAASWRKYKKAVTGIFAAVQRAIKATDDGKLDEKESKEIAELLVTAAYDVKDLL